MADDQTTRDRQVLPMYQLTCQLATLQPPPPQLQQLLGAVHGNHEAMDALRPDDGRGAVPTEFSSEQHMSRILANA